MKIKVFRAHLDDVENLSYGKGAKKQRGTGSRHVCHRLNRDERRQYDLAKRDGYLTVRGTGYRKERKGSPVYNTFRQRCDALEEICVVHEKRSGLDWVVIDFSTLRVPYDSDFVSLIVENVFKVKYPNIYDRFKRHGSYGDENDGNETNLTSDTAVIHESTLNTPINWDAVKTKPIWGVDERLITVECDRDVAKRLAKDVLKESIINFGKVQIDFSLEMNIEHSLPKRSDENKAIITKSLPAHDEMNINDDEDDNSIDWNDI